MSTKRKTNAKHRTPREARTYRQICELPRDNIGTPNFWLQLDVNTVTLAAQHTGEPASEMISIPRRTFERFIRWYETGSTKP